MCCRIIPHELMFDPSVPGCFRPLTRQEIQAERLPKPDPVDVFRNNPTEKLRRMRQLKDEDGTLALALDAIWHFFYGDRDKQGNLLLSRDCQFDCGVDLYYELSSYLLDEERWARLMDTEPLHVCYEEFVKPLKEFIAKLLEDIERRKEHIA
ncbi:MAG: hypothetical protein IJH79_03935 [Lentisphaeria bacterium]|nr:hypothetical protein [Lentisphaeria bacterium]